MERRRETAPAESTRRKTGRTQERPVTRASLGTGRRPAWRDHGRGTHRNTRDDLATRRLPPFRIRGGGQSHARLLTRTRGEPAPVTQPGKAGRTPDLTCRQPDLRAAGRPRPTSGAAGTARGIDRGGTRPMTTNTPAWWLYHGHGLPPAMTRLPALCRNPLPGAPSTAAHRCRHREVPTPSSPAVWAFPQEFRPRRRLWRRY